MRSAPWLVGGEPQAVPDLSTADIRQGATLSANYPPGSGTVTRRAVFARSLDPTKRSLSSMGRSATNHPPGV